MFKQPIDVDDAAVFVPNRDDRRVMHGPNVYEHEIHVAAFARLIGQIPSRGAHRRIDLSGRAERISPINPEILMFSGKLRRHQNPALLLEKLRCDLRTAVGAAPGPEHARIAALGQRLDRPERPRLAPANRREPTSANGSATDAWLASSEANSSSSRAHPISS